MSHCKTIYRLAVAALATSALAAPAAIAMTPDPAADMHASTVVPPATQQEHRTPDAMDRSTPKAPPVYQDLRSPDAVDPTRAPEPQPVPAGMPTWPVQPEPIAQPAEPAVLPTGGDGVDWTLPAIALAGCLMVGGALVAARTRLRSA